MNAVLWAAVVVLVLYAGWLTLPRPVDLDWERFFKLSMVTLLRGPVEEEAGSSEAWMEQGRERVWFHPASRDLELKLRDPAGYTPPFPSLPGERALLERLAALPPEERLAAVFSSGQDELLYDDPVSFGEDWDLAPILGPEVSWELVAHWNPPVAEGLRRRHDRTRWVLFGEAAALAPALEEALGEGSVAVAPQEGAEAFLDELLPDLADRVVMVAFGEACQSLARLLQGQAGLRDKTLAVIALQACFDAAWMEASFDHESMDTEVSRATPYFSLWFAGAGLEGLAASRWPSPEVPATGRVSVDPIDLGLLPGEPALDETLGRALLLCVTARVALSG